MSVVIGMSGGIDSAVSAALLKELGEHVTGVTLHFSQNSSCCDAGSVQRAKAQCERLGIAWHEIDMQDAFRCRVIEPFWRAMNLGYTPNPCVLCNEHVKWKGLLAVADELHADFIASGHYAGIFHGSDGDQICRGIDAAKDQSYFLYRLSAEQRRRVLFPLAGRTKSEVMALAPKWFSTDLLAHHESQDLCFVKGSMRDAAMRHLSDSPGNIIRADGTTVGRHDGLAFYTIGQRSRLGISAATRLYVVAKRRETNELVVGQKSDCLNSLFEVSDLRWQHIPTGMLPSFFADVVTRYRSRPIAGKISRISEDRVSVLLREPVFAVTPGQAVVFYDGRCILGGGTIV